ncbi:MAG TPA: tetratricopeptide repeat protein [Chthonomonadales bacterium]|nr:tetratricopeptide repeat protein [Chthonomonadales bacterium]
MLRYLHSIAGTLLCCAATSLVLAAAPHAGSHYSLSLTLDHKNGDRISDVADITARVQSTAIIQKVEFRVDGTLRATVTSVPYRFSWDTLADTEGQHTLTATAYDENGSTARAGVKLIIDNQLGEGAAAMDAKAQAALSINDTDAARRYARRAVKVDPQDTAALTVLADLAAQNGDIDTAISTLEKARGASTDSATMLKLAGYLAQRALTPDYQTRFFVEAQKIAALRQSAADMAVESARKSGDPIRIGDALMNACRFSEAILAYRPAVKDVETAPVSAIDRLALADVMSDKLIDASNLLRPVEYTGRADAGTHAVHSLAYLRNRQFTQAREIIAEGDLSGHNPAALMAAAYADYALSRPDEAFKEAKEAAGLLPGSPDALFCLAIANKDPVDEEQDMLKSLLSTPFEAGPYDDYAARQSIKAKAGPINEALAITDYVLKRDPGDVYARIIQVMSYIQQDRFEEAQPILAGLIRSEPRAPDILMAESVWWNVKKNSTQAAEFLASAGQADVKRFSFTEAQTPPQFLYLLNHTLRYRAGFFLTPASLTGKS